MSLGKIVRQHRESQNLRLKDVAEGVGCSIRYIQYIERGKKFPRRKILKQLCIFLKIENVPYE